MALTVRPLHPLFAGEVTGIELRQVHDRETLEAIRAGMDEYGVLVFRDQPFEDTEQMAFAQRLDGQLHAKTGASVLTRSRLGTEAIADISNVGSKNTLYKAKDRQRQYSLGNRLWHTDASFQDPAGRYSMLSARVLPPVAADTEFADMRSAFDALPPDEAAPLHDYTVHHTIAHSRETLGFSFSEEERERLKGAVHPLVRVNPRTGRQSLYLASHAARIMELPVPDGRLLLRDLMDHATQREFVYCHRWRERDLVIWDNLATMHRARPFDDTVHRRELRRVTTLDLPLDGSAEVPVARTGS